MEKRIKRDEFARALAKWVFFYHPIWVLDHETTLKRLDDKDYEISVNEAWKLYSKYHLTIKSTAFMCLLQTYANNPGNRRFILARVVYFADKLPAQGKPKPTGYCFYYQDEYEPDDDKAFPLTQEFIEAFGFETEELLKRARRKGLYLIGKQYTPYRFKKDGTAVAA